MVDPELSRVQSGQSIEELTEQQRQQFPVVIYEYGSDSEIDRNALSIALEAVQSAGLPVVGDITVDKESGLTTGVIRTATTDRRELNAESALMHGASAVARQSFSADQLPVDATAHMRARTLTAVTQITSDPKLFEGFQNYYGGLRWGTDQDKFTRLLFESATPFDPQIVDSSLRSDNLYGVAEAMGVEPTGSWYKKTNAEIFAELPVLDYHQLEDPAFHASEMGKKLEAAYAKETGAILAQRYTNPSRFSDTNSANTPVIPLTGIPLVEAIIIDEISTMRPKAKYDFGPQEVVGIVLGSDSLPAQQALVSAVTTRLPKEQRYVFDGPDELQQKRHVVSELAHAYVKAYGTSRQEHFKDQLLSVLDAYTGVESIGADIREQYFDELKYGSTWNSDVSGAKDIVKRILITGFASPNAEDFISRVMPDVETRLSAGEDPLELTSVERMEVVLDALVCVDSNSRPEVFSRLGEKAFGSEHVGQVLRQVAELRTEASRLTISPAILLARQALAKSSFSIGHSPEQLAARANFDEAMAPSRRLFEAASSKLNDLLMDALHAVAGGDFISDDPSVNQRYFTVLVDRISISGDMQDRELPEEYHSLITLAERSGVDENQKSHILWKVAERLKYCGEEMRPVLIQVVLDGYRVMLGEPDELRMPSDRTAHGLAALTNLAYNNPIFKDATEDQLLLLERYRSGIAQMRDMLANKSLPGSTVEIVLADGEVDTSRETQGRNIERVANEVEQLANKYREFLHLEQVKLMPHVYYPWLIGELVPFWRKMQHEVGPGNRPDGDIRALHGMLQDHISNKLDIREDEYPEDFDVFASGSLDTLLIECYERMVVPHDIKYNGTVWRDGLSFMTNAIAMMPLPIIEKFKVEHPEKKNFIKYIEANHAYWNKTESSDWK